MNLNTDQTTLNDKEIVAIIDDDESIRKALLRTLVGAGLEVLAFPSAQDFSSSGRNRTRVVRGFRSANAGH
jgi:FixJ family two-component response regulator